MIERAQSKRKERCNDVGCYVEGIKLPAVRKQALQRFGTESKSKRNDNESEIENPAPSRIEDPIESGCQDEKCEEMQGFWIDLRDLGRTES